MKVYIYDHFLFTSFVVRNKLSRLKFSQLLNRKRSFYRRTIVFQLTMFDFSGASCLSWTINVKLSQLWNQKKDIFRRTIILQLMMFDFSGVTHLIWAIYSILTGIPSLLKEIACFSLYVL